jgi:hypothetical protein
VTARWLRRFVAVAGFRPFVVGSAAARTARAAGGAARRPPAPEPPAAPTIEVVSVERDLPDEAEPAADGGVEVVPDEDPDRR